MGRIARAWQRAPVRLRLAYVSLGVVAVGWPTTAVLEALGVPVFKQVMLALSWLAPAYTAIDMHMTAQLHDDKDR